jgi:transposase-like protein
MNCPHCHSPKTQKDGQRQLHTGQRVQGYRCTACKKRLNERTGTPMSRLRTPQAVVETALKARSEGLGVRATARVLDKSHNSISKWESRLAAQESKWSPTPGAETEVTLEGDELYTKVEKNRPAHESPG